MSNTYWNHSGKFESAANVLSNMIPAMGEVPNPRKNKALEKFRKASNCYYDLYNNGLFNRAQEFARIFKIPSSRYRRGRWDGRGFYEEMYTLVESAMDDIVQRAAIEQGISLEEPVVAADLEVA